MPAALTRNCSVLWPVWALWCASGPKSCVYSLFPTIKKAAVVCSVTVGFFLISPCWTLPAARPHMDAARVDYTRPAHAERCAQTLHVRTVTRQSNVDLALSLVSASARAGLHVDANLVDGGASAPTNCARWKSPRAARSCTHAPAAQGQGGSRGAGTRRRRAISRGAPRLDAPAVSRQSRPRVPESQPHDRPELLEVAACAIVRSW